MLESDIEALPFPDDETELDFTFWETVLAEDTLLHFVEFVRLGQKSALLKNPADGRVFQLLEAARGKCWSAN